MEQFFAYQKDTRIPCKYGRKCFQTNKEHVEKYKHPPKKADVEVDITKNPRKRDSKGKMKSNRTNNSREPPLINNRNDLNEENQSSHDTNDMEVPEQSNITVDNTIENEASGSSSINNQNTTEYVIPSMRQRPQHQQQLLLTNTALEDCSGGDGIVPCTPTLYTPRRLDGETVSSPHVPSSSQAQRFTFVGESQTSQISDLNDGEQPRTSEQIVVIPNVVNNWNTRITQLFLVGEMPKEFYDFWYFCKSLSPTQPEDALLSVGLKLVGPYDVLAGRMNEFYDNDIENTVLHWRYYYDPPEFQTIIASTDSEYHIGYYRDIPLANPVYVVSNDSSKHCVIQKLGKSLFQALRKYLKKNSNDVALSLKKQLLAYEKNKVIPILEGRNVLPVAKTFHTAGIVVPYDSKTDVGYRPFLESEKTIRNILQFYREASVDKKIKALDKLQPMINHANIASDECDFGTGLELGINIFCDGNPELHRICKQLLVTAYNLLRRPQFATIIKAHLENRRKGPNMSIL